MNVGELLRVLQDAMDELKGKDVRKKTAARLIQEAASRLPLIAPPFSVNSQKLWYRTTLFGDIPIIEFNACYGKDKRTCDGFGYQIQKVDVSLIRDMPMDLDISMLDRRLLADAARERREEAIKNKKSLELQIAKENKTIIEMDSIIEKYS